MFNIFVRGMSYNLKERVHSTFNQYFFLVFPNKKIVIILGKYIAKLHKI